MTQDEELLNNIPWSNVTLKDDDLYYLGVNYEEKEWEMLGVFTTLQKAYESSYNGCFIVRIPIDQCMEPFLVHPKQSWWNIEGELLKSERFYETNSD